MTGLAPPPASSSESAVDRAVRGEAREEALSVLMQRVRTDAGREEIGAALRRRLGDAAPRRETVRALRAENPDGSSLFGSLLAGADLPDTTAAAREMVWVLKSAHDRDTSEELMRRAMGLVLDLVTGPAARDPSHRSEAAPDREAPERAVERRPTAAPAAPVDRALAAQAVRAAPGYDPDGPFVIPDRVVRFGAQGETLAAPLFAPDPSFRGAGPVRVPSALPPPPETSDPDLVRGWLRGVPAFPDALGVRAGLLDGGDPGDLMEIEAEFHTDPAAALRLYKAAGPVPDGTADAAWCVRLGRDVGRYGVTHERAVERLAAALREQVRQGPADRSDPLVRNGAVLIVREELAEAVCGLIDAEAEYLADGPQEAHGPDQNLLGSFSPDGDLARGRCLERALVLHLSAGAPMGGAMRQSLAEFRIAQALRENPQAPVDALNRRFDLDPALPLSELSGRAPVVRLGWTEPVLD